jgi:hypothetical protein
MRESRFRTGGEWPQLLLQDPVRPWVEGLLTEGKRAAKDGLVRRAISLRKEGRLASHKAAAVM